MKKGILLLTAVAALLALGFGAQNAMAQGTVTAIVLDADGAGVSGAQVALMGTHHERGQRPYMDQGETNERGVCVFAEVPAGMYQVAARSELGMAHAEVGVRDGQDVQVRLVLQGRGGGGGGGDVEVGTVVGVVLTPDGEGVEGARISVHPLRHERGMGNMRGFRAITDADGRFAIANVPAGVYMVTAMVRGGMAQARLEVVADQRNQVELVLRRMGRFHRD